MLCSAAVGRGVATTRGRDQATHPHPQASRSSVVEHDRIEDLFHAPRRTRSLPSSVALIIMSPICRGRASVADAERLRAAMMPADRDAGIMQHAFRRPARAPERGDAERHRSATARPPMTTSTRRRRFRSSFAHNKELRFRANCPAQRAPLGIGQPRSISSGADAEAYVQPRSVIADFEEASRPRHIRQKFARNSTPRASQQSDYRIPPHHRTSWMEKAVAEIEAGDDAFAASCRRC